MRKLVQNVFLLVLMIFGKVNAQDEPSFSIIAGPNYAKGNGNKPTFESKAKFGYCLGASIQTKLKNKLGLEFQIVYSYNQAKYNVSFYDGFNHFSYIGTQKVGFLDMPILITYPIERSFLDRFKIGVVPSWALFAHADTKYHKNFDGDERDGNFIGDNDNVFKATDIAFTVGIGIRLSEGLGLDVRYLHGLRSIIHRVEYGKVWRSVTSVMLTKSL